MTEAQAAPNAPLDRAGPALRWRSSWSCSTPRSSTSRCRRSARRWTSPQSNLPWVVNAYVLTFGGFLLLGGRIADLLGRRRVFMAGLVLFALASLAGGLADHRGPADRRPRGAGPRRRDPLARRALDRHHDLPRRRRAQQGARRLGRGRRLRRRRRRAARRRPDRRPGLGVGAVGERADRHRRRRARAGADRREPRPSRDPPLRHRRRGHASPPACRCSSTRSSTPTDAGWGSTQTIGLLALAVALLAAFVAIELRSTAPLVPFRIFRIRTSPAPTWSAC